MEKSNVRLDANSGNGKPEQQRKLDSTMEMGQSLEGSKNKGASYIETEGVVLLDTFRGDIFQLIDSIKSLIELDMENALVPHGIGGHARNLLSSSAIRLEQLRQRVAELESLLKEAYADADEVLRPRVAELEKERDELLAALEAGRRLIELISPFEGDVTRQIDKAIASVKEKQNVSD